MKKAARRRLDWSKMLRYRATMELQPIDTVPRDGTLVILRDYAGREACYEIRETSVTLRGQKDEVPKVFHQGKLASWVRWRPAKAD
jgi:hypothetical protein